jgi:hypothetical protein
MAHTYVDAIAHAWRYCNPHAPLPSAWVPRAAPSGPTKFSGIPRHSARPDVSDRCRCAHSPNGGESRGKIATVNRPH